MIEVHRHTDREQDMNSEIRKAWIETREEWHIEIHLYSVNRESTRETVGVASERGIQTERQTQRQADRQTDSDIKRESGESRLIVQTCFMSRNQFQTSTYYWVL